ncbi:MAG TPA: hypothetical protein PKK15_14860 [Kouleothrix sp.]|uniref:hypothetical protein n=1 Tax=Kouleothrix sp. TaxID=2779161 RepID=UPI002C98C7F9|nr:hypothetical protein [Kouleothrix sp.]
MLAEDLVDWVHGGFFLFAHNLGGRRLAFGRAAPFVRAAPVPAPGIRMVLDLLFSTKAALASRNPLRALAAEALPLTAWRGRGILCPENKPTVGL